MNKNYDFSLDEFLYYFFIKIAEKAEEVLSNFDEVELLKYRQNIIERLDSRRIGKMPFQIYLIGSVSGKQFNNIEAFFEAKFALSKFKINTVIPHEKIDKNASWLTAMSESFKQLDEASVVCLIDDEESSTGSQLEKIACTRAGIMVFNLDELENFLSDFYYILDKAIELQA